MFGSTSTCEPGYARQLLPLLNAGMLLLADRNFSGDELRPEMNWKSRFAASGSKGM
ncbi:hypothetical protein WJM95_34470 [Streptomyces sp. f51]|uniref:hypothetical protein n=1 Tax=Streptomyces sp. f51 TaxID=1827742 RepID=UPI0030D3274B